MTDHPRPAAGPGQRFLVVVTLVAVIGAVALATAYVVLRHQDDSSGYVSRDLDGHRVVWGTPPDVSGAQVRPTGQRFVAPRLHLSVPLLSAELVGGLINPPSLTAAYWYREFGDPSRPHGRTSVVAMHSVRGGRGPGNAFIEPAPDGRPGRVRVERGDPLIVGGARYRVTRVLIEPKATTAGDARVWGDPTHRDRMVVITCLLDPDVPLVDEQNLVVVAALVSHGRR